MDIPTRLRLYKDSDISFVRDSFFKAAAGAYEFTGMSQDISKPGFRRRFEKFSKVSEIWLIGDAEHDEPLFGWIAVTNLKSHSIVWWIYVKSGYRNLGFAKKLLTTVKFPNKIIYPFKSRISAPLAIEIGAIYNPFVYEELCFED